MEKEDHANNCAEKYQHFPAGIALINHRIPLSNFLENWESANDKCNIEERAGPLYSEEKENIGSRNEHDSEIELRSYGLSQVENTLTVIAA